MSNPFGGYQIKYHRFLFREFYSLFSQNKKKKQYTSIVTKLSSRLELSETYYKKKKKLDEKNSKWTKSKNEMETKKREHEKKNWIKLTKIEIKFIFYHDNVANNSVRLCIVYIWVCEGAWRINECIVKCT